MGANISKRQDDERREMHRSHESWRRNDTVALTRTSPAGFFAFFPAHL